MEACPGRNGTKSRTAPAMVSYSRSSVTTGQLTGLFSRNHQSGGNGRQTLAAAGQPEAVGGGGRNRNRRLHQLGQNPLSLVAARPDLGPVTDHLDRSIAHREARFAQ